MGDQLGEDKTIEVVRKTWAKMSPQGQEAARTLDLAPTQRDLLERAIGSD